MHNETPNHRRRRAPRAWRRYSCAGLILVLTLVGCKHFPRIPRLIPKGEVAEHADTAGEAGKQIASASDKIIELQKVITSAANDVAAAHPEAKPTAKAIIESAEESRTEAMGIGATAVLLNELERDLDQLSASVTALEGEKANLVESLAQSEQALIDAQNESEQRRQRIMNIITFGLIGIGTVILAVSLGYLRNVPAAATGGILMISGLALWALQPYMTWIIGGTVVLVLFPYIYQLYDHDRHRCALEEKVMNDDPDVEHEVSSRRTADLVENIRHKTKRKFHSRGR